MIVAFWLQNFGNALPAADGTISGNEYLSIDFEFSRIHHLESLNFAPVAVTESEQQALFVSRALGEISFNA